MEWQISFSFFSIFFFFLSCAQSHDLFKSAMDINNTFQHHAMTSQLHITSSNHNQCILFIYSLLFYTNSLIRHRMANNNNNSNKQPPQ